MIIDSFYLLGEALASRYDDAKNKICPIIVLIGTAIISFVLAIILIFFCFKWFSNCTSNIFINIVNLILIIIAVIL